MTTVDPMTTLSGSYPNIVPLSIREAPSITWTVEVITKYINDQLVPFINDNINTLSENWVTETTRLISEWETLSVALVNQVQDIANGVGDSVALAQAAQAAAETARDLAAQYASQAEEIQDLAVTGILNNINSVFRAALIAMFATNETVDGIKTEMTHFVNKIVVQGAGVDSTGVDDSTVAIQALLDEAVSTGKILYFPAGKYRITSSLTVKYTNANSSTVRIEGEFSGTAIYSKTEIVLDGAGITGFEISLDGYPAEGYEISGLSFSAPSTSAGYQTAIAIKFIKSNTNYSRKFIIEDVNASGIYALVEFSSTFPALNNYGYYGPVRISRVHLYSMVKGIIVTNATLNLFSIEHSLLHGCSAGGIDTVNGGTIYLEITGTHFEGCEPAAFVIGGYHARITARNVSSENTGDVSGNGLISGAEPSNIFLSWDGQVYPFAFMPLEIRMPRQSTVNASFPVRVSGEGVTVTDSKGITPAVSNSVAFNQTDKRTLINGPLNTQPGKGTPVFKTLAGSTGASKRGIGVNSTEIPEGLRTQMIGVKGGRIIASDQDTFTAPSDGFIYVAWNENIESVNSGFAVASVVINGVECAPPTGYRYKAHTGTSVMMFPIVAGQILSVVRLTLFNAVWSTPAMVTFSPKMLTLQEIGGGPGRKRRRSDVLVDTQQLTINDIGDNIAGQSDYAVKVRVTFNRGAQGVYESIFRGNGTASGIKETNIISDLPAELSVASSDFPSHSDMFRLIAINGTGINLDVETEIEYLS